MGFEVSTKLGMEIFFLVHISFKIIQIYRCFTTSCCPLNLVGQ